MSTAQGYHDAFLALSTNAALAEARNNLLTGIGNDELIEVIAHGLKTGISRPRLNAITKALLEEIVTARADNKTATPGEGESKGSGSKHAFCNNNRSKSADGGSVPCEGDGALNFETNATANSDIVRQPTPAAQVIPSQDASAIITLQSPADVQRKAPDWSGASLRKRRMPVEMDSEEEIR